MSERAGQGGAVIAAEALRAAREGPPVAVATVIRAPEGSGASPGAKLLVRADGSRLGGLGDARLEGEVARDLAALLSPDTTPGVHTRRYGEVEVMIEVVAPPATLLVVGAGHIGQALCAMGAQVGFAVEVLDDREEFANRARLPAARRVLCGDVSAELRRYAIDGRTYVVLVSRGHRQDEVALRAVVGRGAAYVGMIGSRRRVTTVLRHLASEGFAAADLSAVRTPIGLDIGAETPEEIAVSILAEVIMTRRGGTGRPLSGGGRRRAAR